QTGKAFHPLTKLQDLQHLSIDIPGDLSHPRMEPQEQKAEDNASLTLQIPSKNRTLAVNQMVSQILAETASFTELRPEANPKVFESLAQLSQLKALSFAEATPLPNYILYALSTSMPQLERLVLPTQALNVHQILQAKPLEHLHTLVITISEDACETAFTYISQLKGLRKLKICVEGNKALFNFEKLGLQLPHLEFFNIVVNNDIQGEILPSLYTLKKKIPKCRVYCNRVEIVAKKHIGELSSTLLFHILQFHLPEIYVLTDVPKKALTAPDIEHFAKSC